eukprot:461511-Hanusia_phi.AAC.1
MGGVMEDFLVVLNQFLENDKLSTRETAGRGWRTSAGERRRRGGTERGGAERECREGRDTRRGRGGRKEAREQARQGGREEGRCKKNLPVIQCPMDRSNVVHSIL